MQEKESIMAVRCVENCLSGNCLVSLCMDDSASLVMPNSYPRDRIFNFKVIKTGMI